MKLPLLARKIEESCRIPSCITDRSLPLCYMSDYSVMGIVVDAVEECVQVLEVNEFAILRDALNVEVILAENSEAYRLMATLREHGLGCEIADVAEEIYQG